MKLANLIIISGIINMPTAIQWHETLSILAYAASILIYPCMYAINQETNVNEWTFLIMTTVTLGIGVWWMCKSYLDTYVHPEKI